MEQLILSFFVFFSLKTDILNILYFKPTFMNAYKTKFYLIIPVLVTSRTEELAQYLRCVQDDNYF